MAKKVKKKIRKYIDPDTGEEKEQEYYFLPRKMRKQKVVPIPLDSVSQAIAKEKQRGKYI